MFFKSKKQPEEMPKDESPPPAPQAEDLEARKPDILDGDKAEIEQEEQPLLLKQPANSNNDLKSSNSTQQYKTLNDLKRENKHLSSDKSSHMKFAEGGDDDRVDNNKLCLCCPSKCIAILFGLLLIFAFIYECIVCIIIFYNDMFTNEYAGFYIVICGVYLVPIFMFIYFGCVDGFKDMSWICFAFTAAAVVNLWFFMWNVIYIFGYYPRPDVFLRQDMMWIEGSWGENGQDHGHAYIVQTKGQYFLLHGGLELLLSIVFAAVALNIYVVYRQ